MIYGCIAEKLGHSFSKDIHNRLFDYNYELLEVPKDKLDDFMQKKDFKAINVTIPYKESVIPHLDYVSDIAKKIGAVNTIVNENGYLKGYNTDFEGMKALLQKNEIDIRNKKVLILGSGGTSKTAFALCESLEAEYVYRVSRIAREDCVTYEYVKENCNDVEIIINTTPVGMYPNIGYSPISLDDYTNIVAVVDAVYNPLRSKLVCDAANKGIKAVGGLYMLVAQAVFAAEKFIDTKVEKKEIDRVYKEIIILKENIVLTGMPGSGKSTIGKLLAKELGRVFIDTDEEIVKKVDKPIPQIFAELGEEGFRKIENEVIKEISSIQSAVIATGGGAILNPENIEFLRENGKVYFIDRDIEHIVATSDRPLSSNKADLEKRYKERYPLYTSRCDRHIRICNDANKNMQMIKKDFCDENTCN